VLILPIMMVSTFRGTCQPRSLAALFLGELLEPEQLAGMLLTGLAPALLDGRMSRSPRPAKQRRGCTIAPSGVAC